MYGPDSTSAINLSGLPASQPSYTLRNATPSRIIKLPPICPFAQQEMGHYRLKTGSRVDQAQSGHWAGRAGPPFEPAFSSCQSTIKKTKSYIIFMQGCSLHLADKIEE
jgi:hypothetical protein